MDLVTVTHVTSIRVALLSEIFPYILSGFPFASQSCTYVHIDVTIILVDVTIISKLHSDRQLRLKYLTKVPT